MPAPSPTPAVNSPAFAPVDTGGGAIDTLYANGGIVNLRTDRSQERNIPWAAPPPPLLRKLTHFRAPGMGDAMWSGACVYDIPGVSPSFSEYDQPDFVSGPETVDGDNYVDQTAVSRGVVVTHRMMPVAEPSTTRRPRVAAVFDSAPSAAFFQGYFNPRWSGLLSGYRPQIAPRPLHSNFNPPQMGTKELHKATQYQPVPPMGSLVGYFGSNDKAL
jgi:hypothetical protein